MGRHQGRNRLTPEEWADRIAGNVRELARAATSVENRRPEAEALLRLLSERASGALIVGLTGSPGVGKSTLADGLIRAWRAESKTVAVIAVDPTSPQSGGAILGDRIRMQRHWDDPGVFIRSMATRGHTGGVARATSDLALLCAGSGRDLVIVETVGVGQSEVDVAGFADVAVVVLAPGMGDDVQAMKAGLMEVADVFTINKADREGVEQLERELHQLPPRADGWTPSVVKTVAHLGQGIAELREAIDKCRQANFRARRAAALWAKRAEQHAGWSIDHLGVAVRSIDKALGFYRDSLGFDAAHRETVAHEGVNVAMLPAAGSRIELIEPLDDGSAVAKFIAGRGEGLHHVALRTPRVRETVERLRTSGARLINEPRTGAGGHTYVFVHPESTGGVLLELIEEKE